MPSSPDYRPVQRSGSVRSMDKSLPLGSALIALAALLTTPVSAQTPPDAGRILQEQAPTLEQPKASPNFNFSAPSSSTPQSGGPQVQLQGIQLSGNSLFSEAELLAVLGATTGRSYDLGGLRRLANQLTEHYRAAGYPFARVFIPAQNLADGVLQLQVVEGRYGQVGAQGEGRLAEQANAFLSDLRPGTVIASDKLERATLILDDQPGIKTTPIMRPGQEVGSGDLQVRVEREPLLSGEVGLDNHGNRYTGEHRGFFNLRANSPFMLGDQLSLRSLYTEEGMWYGSLDYSLPLGGSGLRGKVGYAHTYYELGKEFADLDARGTAKVSSAGLSYPLLRSQRANLVVSATYQHKQLRDEYQSTDTRLDKSSDSLPVSLQFDLRDSLGGGGITFGALTWTPGELHLDSGLRAADRLSAKSAGRFDKLNLDVARLQLLPAGFSLYGRFSGQLANDNLDSSEDFGLGGPTGVRAYPSGEGYGDEGWLSQLELRYAMGAFSPFVFHDSGRVSVAHDTWQAGDNHRSLSGAGAGLRFSQGPWQAEATVAWRTAGGKPESDSRDRVPTSWLSAQYNF